MTLFMVGPKGELKMGQKDLLRSATIIAALGLSLTSSAAESINSTPSDQPLFQTLSQAQWKRMLPDLGDASPEIAILRVDPNTHATQLLIRTPQGLHVRKHWHSANETHTRGCLQQAETHAVYWEPSFDGEPCYRSINHPSVCGGWTAITRRDRLHRE